MNKYIFLVGILLVCIYFGNVQEGLMEKGPYGSSSLYSYTTLCNWTIYAFNFSIITKCIYGT